MSELIRRYIPGALLTILSIVMFIEFFVNPRDIEGLFGASSGSFARFTGDLQSFAIIIAAFAMGLGALNLLIIHGSFIRKRASGQWPYSLWLLAVMIAFTFIGVGMGTSSYQYQYLFINFFQPNDMTMYSLIGWLVVYAIYLTFRVRTYETLVLLVVAVFALLGNAPIGGAVYPPLTDIKSWLATVPNTASVRGFNLAMAMGAIVVALRTFMGRERGAMGG